MSELLSSNNGGFLVIHNPSFFFHTLLSGTDSSMNELEAHKPHLSLFKGATILPPC